MMRLWHKDLIPYLPKQQLLGQWRELNSIYKLQNKHLLINFVYKENNTHLIEYSILTIKEMRKRNYKCDITNFLNYINLSEADFNNYFYNNDFPMELIYKDKMNDRYLKQCLYNLQEKYDCGGISKEEWQIIEERFGDYLE